MKEEKLGVSFFSASADSRGFRTLPFLFLSPKLSRVPSIDAPDRIVRQRRDLYQIVACGNDRDAAPDDRRGAVEPATSSLRRTLPQQGQLAEAAASRITPGLRRLVPARLGCLGGSGEEVVARECGDLGPEPAVGGDPGDRDGLLCFFRRRGRRRRSFVVGRGRRARCRDDIARTNRSPWSSCRVLFSCRI